MAGPTGFEPAISSVTGWHVWPLHHGPAGVTVAESTRHRQADQMADPDLSSPMRRAAVTPYPSAANAAATAPAAR